MEKQLLDFNVPLTEDWVFFCCISLAIKVRPFAYITNTHEVLSWKQALKGLTLQQSFVGHAYSFACRVFGGKSCCAPPLC